MTLKELHNPDKTSEAIIRLCDPLRKKYKDKNLKVIISITVMAWNISLFPKEEQANAQEILLRPLLKQIKGDEVSVILKGTLHFGATSGKRKTLLPFPPLRTVLESFPSYGSSLC